MKRQGALLGSVILGGALVTAATPVMTLRQGRAKGVQAEEASPQAAPTSSPTPSRGAITYKVASSVRTALGDDTLIVLSVVEPATFTRDRMLLLARQLNEDFSTEQRLYAVIFDSVDAWGEYVLAGPNYSRAMKSVRAEYRLDRVKGRESINFSSRRGNPLNEVDITLSGRSSHRVKRKRKLPKQL